MPYATILHVEALDKGRGPFTASTKPTATEVAIFLEQTAAELDGILADRGYSVPVATGASSARKLLELYNAQGANCLVQRAAQQSVKDGDACDMYERAKLALAGGVILPDAGFDSSNLPLYPEAASAVFTMGQQASPGGW